MADAKKKDTADSGSMQKKRRRRRKAVLIEQVVEDAAERRPVVLSAEPLLTHPDIVKAVRRNGKMPRYLAEQARQMGRRYVTMYVHDDECAVKEVAVKIPRYHLIKIGNIQPAASRYSRVIGPIRDLVTRAHARANQAGRATGERHYFTIPSQSRTQRKPVADCPTTSSLNDAPIMTNEELSEFLILDG